jgi:hypothetical protein
MHLFGQSCLGGRRRNSATFEANLFAKKVNASICGDMTRPTVYSKPQYSEVHCDRVLLIL